MKSLIFATLLASLPLLAHCQKQSPVTEVSVPGNILYAAMRYGADFPAKPAGKDADGTTLLAFTSEFWSSEYGTGEIFIVATEEEVEAIRDHLGNYNYARLIISSEKKDKDGDTYYRYFGIK